MAKSKIKSKVEVTEDDKIVGRNIRRTRKEHRHTQKFLAEQANYSDNHLCAVENGRKPVSFDLVKRLAAYYNKTLDYFYKGTSMRPLLILRIRVIAAMMEELSNSSIEAVECMVKRLWSAEHGEADPSVRLEEISNEVIKKSEDE